MKELFNDIMGLKGVNGALFIDANRQIKLEAYNFSPAPRLKPHDLAAFIKALGDNKETELHFENLRLYIRKIETGHLFLLTGYNAQMALVRLNCDVLAPMIKAHLVKPTGIGRFFKK